MKKEKGCFASILEKYRGKLDLFEKQKHIIEEEIAWILTLIDELKNEEEKNNRA